LWAAAKAKSVSEGVTLTDVLIEALKVFLDTP
jgi:hypothetical protein